MNKHLPLRRELWADVSHPKNRKFPFFPISGSCIPIFHTPAFLQNHKQAAYFSVVYYKNDPLNFQVCTAPVLPILNAGYRGNSLQKAYAIPAFD